MFMLAYYINADCVRYHVITISIAIFRTMKVSCYKWMIIILLQPKHIKGLATGFRELIQYNFYRQEFYVFL